MKKILLVILGIIGITMSVYFLFSLNNRYFISQSQKIEEVEDKDEVVSLEDALYLLSIRQDKDALEIFEEIISTQPDNIDSLWGKAEVLRRSRDYKQSEELLNRILSKNPKYIPALISMSYIRYKEDKLNEAMKLVNEVLDNKDLDKENQALSYMLLGMINTKRASKGWLFSKIKYGTQVKGYFLKARDLAPDLAEVHLGLGTFYLLAPKIAGGNLDKAIEELNYAYNLAPSFATVNARLAQAYKKKGDSKKYRFHLRRTQELDPNNEVLAEILK